MRKLPVKFSAKCQTCDHAEAKSSRNQTAFCLKFKSRVSLNGICELYAWKHHGLVQIRRAERETQDMLTKQTDFLSGLHYEERPLTSIEP